MWVQRKCSIIDFGTGFLDFGAGVEAVQSLWKNINFGT